MTIIIPDSPLCVAATAYARLVSTPSLFHHVMRTYAFGVAYGEAHDMALDRELFHIAAVFHDLGFTSAAPAAQRFEIEGADAAKQWLSRHGMRDADIEVVWDAIALHTTYGVPTRKRPEIALVQIGAAIDVGVVPTSAVAAALPEILEAWPRLRFKAELLAACEQLYDRNPVGALQSHVVADVAMRHRSVTLPNICDVIARADFAE